jgi:hypothetical protein
MQVRQVIVQRAADGSPAVSTRPSEPSAAEARA